MYSQKKTAEKDWIWIRENLHGDANTLNPTYRHTYFLIFNEAHMILHPTTTIVSLFTDTIRDTMHTKNGIYK